MEIVVKLAHIKVASEGVSDRSQGLGDRSFWSRFEVWRIRRKRPVARYQRPVVWYPNGLDDRSLGISDRSLQCCADVFLRVFNCVFGGYRFPHDFRGLVGHFWGKRGLTTCWIVGRALIANWLLASKGSLSIFWCKWEVAEWDIIYLLDLTFSLSGD